MQSRRGFLGTAAGIAAAQTGGAASIVVDPKPLFEISPYLFMQFMEPLGTSDSSVEAAWDYDRDDWRKDFVDTVSGLNPDVVRYGGLYSRYYRWREGVGPADQRPWMRNYVWGGKETNRVGTHEFVDFCRRVGAEPLYCVNFLSDGEKRFQDAGRTGDAREAADWVSYANDPSNADRRAHGHTQPYGIKLWQLGNETSYGGNATFSRDESITRTIEFAKAMRQRDVSIQFIGWGDHGRDPNEYWAPELVKRAGEHVNYIAFHMMGQSPRRPDSVLRGLRYQAEPEQAWQELIELSDHVEARVSAMEQAAGRHPIAITEGHLSLQPGNANPILLEWLAAVYHARSFNIYQRHGSRVRIATAADFQGNRWTVNAVMLQTPRGVSYLTPVGSIARLFKRHGGRQSVAVSSSPSGLDIAASRTGSQVYLHVLNMNYSKPVKASFAVTGMEISSGRAIAIAPENPREYVSQDQPDIFSPTETKLKDDGWTFPPRSVSVIELSTNPSTSR